jgi:hypothetical protein
VMKSRRFMPNMGISRAKGVGLTAKARTGDHRYCRDSRTLSEKWDARCYTRSLAGGGPRTSVRSEFWSC